MSTPESQAKPWKKYIDEESRGVAQISTTVADLIDAVYSGIVGLWLGGGVSTTTSKDEIRRLALRPYQASEQPPNLRHCEGDQFLVRAVAAPFSPCSIA